MKIIFEDVSRRQLAEAIELANAEQKQSVVFHPFAADDASDFNFGGVLRVEDSDGIGRTVGQVQIQHANFTTYRIELSNGWERQMVSRLAFALADQR